MMMMMMPWWLVVPLPGVGVDLVRPLYLFIISYYYFGVNLETNDGGCDTAGGAAPGAPSLTWTGMVWVVH